MNYDSSKSKRGAGDPYNFAKIFPMKQFPNSRPLLIYHPAAGFSPESDAQKTFGWPAILPGGRQRFFGGTLWFRGEGARSGFSRNGAIIKDGGPTERTRNSEKERKTERGGGN